MFNKLERPLTDVHISREQTTSDLLHMESHLHGTCFGHRDNQLEISKYASLLIAMVLRVPGKLLRSSQCKHILIVAIPNLVPSPDVPDISEAILPPSEKESDPIFRQDSSALNNDQDSERNCMAAFIQFDTEASLLSETARLI